ANDSWIIESIQATKKKRALKATPWVTLGLCYTDNVSYSAVMTSGNGGIVELVSRLTKRNPVLSALGAVLVVAVLLAGAYLYLVKAQRTNQTQQRPRRVEETPRPSSGPPGT